MTKPLNILHVASWFPSEKEPMLGNFVERHVEAASDHSKGWVLYAVPYHINKIDITSGENFKACIVYFKKRIPVLDHYLALEKGFKQILRENFKPDLIHLHVTYPSGLWVMRKKIPYMVTEHFTGFHSYSSFRWSLYRKWITSKILNHARIILPVSNKLGEAIKKFDVKTSMHKISNVVSGSFQPIHEKKEHVPTRFIHVSSLVNEQKNISGLLKGFKLAEDSGLDFELTIGGDGNLELLTERIINSGISLKKVKTFGMSSPQEIARLMRKNDCFVLFSNVENQPVVILEALSCGLPVISTNVGGISEEVNDINGMLIPPKDISTLRQALINFNHIKEKFDSSFISKQALDKYSRTAVGKELIGVYNSLVSHKWR